jgi:hypothetical protein
MQVLQPQQQGRVGKWQKEEDERLKAAIDEHGTKWNTVAIAVGTPSTV